MPKSLIKNLNIIFNSQVSPSSMGGGDKIVLSIAKILEERGVLLKFIGCSEGSFLVSNSLPKVTYTLLNEFTASKYGILGSYLLRILFSFKILFLNISSKEILWSFTDFLPDTIPGLIFKLLNPKSSWFGNVFLIARNPFTKEVPFAVNTLLFFISQRTSVFLYKLFATYVFVLNKSDKKALITLGISSNKVIILRGGVDLTLFKSVKEPVIKRYDACYLGRIHYQKGIDILVDTWSRLVRQNKKINLAIVGWGDPYEISHLKLLIKENKLERNTKFLGFLDGVKKIEVLKSSKLLLFPSSYESWGVVVAEALAAGIPVVAFDLPILEQNFKKGVIFAKSFSIEDFTSKAKLLLDSEPKRKRLISESRASVSKFDWEYSANLVLKALKSI